MGTRTSKKLSISLDPVLCAKARAEADRRKVTFSWLVARALESYFANASAGEGVARLELMERQLARIAAHIGLPAEGTSAAKSCNRSYKGSDDVGFLARGVQKERRARSSAE